jgi:hypothetical protein
MAAEPLRAAAPGAYWREVLAMTMSGRGGHWSVDDLLGAVGECDAGIVEVAGWLSDELAMGRIQRVDAWPQMYEAVPGVRPCIESGRR